MKRFAKKQWIVLGVVAVVAGHGDFRRVRLLDSIRHRLRERPPSAPTTA